MNRTATVGLAFGLVVLAAIGASAISGMKKPAERKPLEKVIKQVKSLTVKNETLTTKLEITGRLQARQKIELFAEVGGRFLPNGNRFKEGNYFKRGQSLLRIEHEEQKLNLLAQKSALMNQVTLMLPDLKSDYAESFPAWESYLQKMDVKTPLTPLPSPVTDREKYFVSARNLYNLFYTIQSQEKRMEKYTIPAPFSGVISATNITEGTLVRAGQKLGEFTNTYTYEMEAAVFEKDIHLIKKGSEVSLFTDDSDKRWTGVVDRISQVVDPATQTIKVFIKVSGKELKEGMYFSAIVQGKKIENAVEIDRNLLQAQNKVFLVENDALKLMKVDPVYFNTNTVIVKGLPNQVTLLDENVAGAFEGMKVALN